jgi:hypothetical protein
MSSYAVSGVSSDVPSERPSLAVEDDTPADPVDPELAALPAPPRRERTLTVVVLSLAALAAFAMALSLRGDLAYALLGGPPASLGDLRAVPEATLASYENRIVRADAMLGAAGGIRYERPFVEDSFRTLPVAGRSDIWVDLRVPAGDESGRWEPPRAFLGRLVRFGESGPRHRGLAGAIAEATHERVAGGGWLLIDGEAPETNRWAIVLCAVFLAFAVGNVVAIGRIVRRVR